ncbi:hypothetical protein SAMN04488105_111118 [Salipiger thiooxidans]|uniref:AAA domain-containing protein n=2 Tax=Salipiger thiooxidans TaxID=282683 RepID=A0A1G7HRE4_9RHOB|nr:hypothetical protein SAMN04488105_111118 [Salipiger thiooxidans]
MPEKDRKTLMTLDDAKPATAIPTLGGPASGPPKFSGTPAAITQMMAWNMEEWEPPAIFGAFPLRKICPDAAERFASAAHFSVRDLRTIIDYMELDTDPKDPVGVYGAILDACENAPWAMPALEVEVGTARLKGKVRGRSSSRDRIGKVLMKLPLMKLRLRSNEHLHHRAHELGMPDPDPEVAIGAFCEYAIQAYYRKLEEMDTVALTQAAYSVLVPEDEIASVNDLLDDLDEITDWRAHADDLIEIHTDYPRARSLTYHEHLTTTMQVLAGMLDLTSPTEDFSRLARLAEIGAQHAHHHAGIITEVLLKSYRSAGFTIDGSTVPKAGLQLLGRLRSAGILERFVDLQDRLPETEERAKQAREKIARAHEEEDYDALEKLVPEARDTKARLEADTEARDSYADMIEKIIAGAIEREDDLPEDIRELIIEDFAEEEASHHAARDMFRGDTDGLEEEADEEPDEETEAGADESGAGAEPSEAAVTDAFESVAPAPENTQASEETTESEDADVADTLNGEDESAAPAPSEPSTDAADEGAHEKSPEDPAEESGPGEDGLPLEEAAPIPAAAETDGAPRSDGTRATTSPAPVPEETLVDLIARNLIGVAADSAEVFEAGGHAWPIEASVLRTAAGSRAPHREYGLDTQRFLSIANRALSEKPGESGSVMLLGALIRPTILEASSGLRSVLPELCRGSLGQHLLPAAESIAALDYDFPPDPDELARISGAQRVPLKKRLATQLSDWCETYSQKTSRWHFATMFMHHVVSDQGLIGAARTAIEKNAPEAPELARQAIDQLDSHSDIEAHSVEFAAEAGRNASRLHPKGIEYLHRQFDEPLGLLDSWLKAAEREGSQGQKSDAKLRATIGNLQTRLEKAAGALEAEAGNDGDPVGRALAGWIALQAREAIRAIEGSDSGSFATLEEAITAERDLLPAATRDAINAPGLRFDAFREALTEGIPGPAEAVDRARHEAAFDTAMRLAARFSIDADADIRREMSVFAETWQAEIERRERRLKTLAKVDYNHQDEITRRLNWCQIALERLAAVGSGSEIHDLADIPVHAVELDDISGTIESNIRDDQVARIGQYRNDRNVDEADMLTGALDDLTIEAIEDRIAQLRDGRSAATFETELEGLIKHFTPEFITYAASAGWPAAPAQFQAALKGEGPLAIDEDRRKAGLEFISLYRDIMHAMVSRKPAINDIRAFFEEIGFENVKLHDSKQIGRTKAWQARMTGTIRTDGWFLPPVFGSKAAAGYRLLMIGPDILPEAALKAAGDMPTILLVAGVADAARRHEFAERLRATATPALLIDEALVAFAATRRDTRARTFFECGLPYGRVEPYTTDAGQIPPEMFFGREEEIRYIMSKTADGCLVYGGRQLGKSALLNHVAKTRHAPEESRIVVRREVKPLGNAEKTSEIWSHLNAMLVPHNVVKPASRDADSICRDIKGWFSTRPEAQVVCMFDETDHFMAADTKADYPELSRLKELMEDTGRAFKVVFAGLHNVQRMHRQPNSPLAHLGQPICIGPLNRTEDDKRAAHDLVVKPMRAAGFRFQSMEAVEEILAWANYYPSLVQEYAKGLLASMHGQGSGKAYRLSDDGPLWTIPTGDLFTHRGYHQIETRIREKFHLTLDLDPRYALVAYTLARLNAEGFEHKSLVSGFTPAELLDEAAAFWPRTAEQPSQAAFEALLEELFDLGVLGRVPIPQTSRYTYLLRTRQVAAMLGSIDDIYHALGEIEEKDPTVAYDRSVHRRRYATGGHLHAQQDLPYSPLTDLQIERIVHRESPPVQLVCGLEPLGLSKVGRALKAISETARLPGAPNTDIPVHLVDNRKDLRARIDKAQVGAGRMTIVVHTPGSAKDAIEEVSWLERQPRVISGHVRPVIILDAADSASRELANRRSDQAQFLSAWGAEMIRVHLHMIEELELDKPATWEAILSAAGGIPSETIELIRKMSKANDPIEVAREWRVSQRFPDPISKGFLGQALLLLELGEGEDYQTFDDLMREQTGCDLVTIGPDLVATGLVAGWSPKVGRIRRSALGDLISRTLES